MRDGWTGVGEASCKRKQGFEARVERSFHLEVFDSKLIIGDSGVRLPGHLIQVRSCCLLLGTPRDYGGTRSRQFLKKDKKGNKKGINTHLKPRACHSAE